MNHSRLFEQLIHELQVMLAASTEYDLIKSSRVLRQLLLDGDALLHLVNRELRVQPTFNVRTNTYNQTDSWLNTEIYCGNDAIPKTALSLQQFLAHQIGASGGESITVRQVIKYAAIILGGVHFKADRGGEYEAVSRFSSVRTEDGLTLVLHALREIGAVTRDALIPIRDSLIKRERFELGRGWTAVLSLEILPGPPDEDNYIIDLGADESVNRFSVYVDARGELTFRLVDRNGHRKYVRAGKMGSAVPAEKPIIIICELSSIENETLLSLRTDGWDHAEIINGSDYENVGTPFHFVTGSDCIGKKQSYLFVYSELVIARPLTQLELAQSVNYFATKAVKAKTGLHYHGNQFLYSNGHPNFTGHPGGA